MLRKGREYLAKGDHKRARSCLESALRRDARCTQANYYLGRLHEERHDARHAVEAYSAVPESDPTYPLSQERLAQTGPPSGSGQLHLLVAASAERSEHRLDLVGAVGGNYPERISRLPYDLSGVRVGLLAHVQLEADRLRIGGLDQLGERTLDEDPRHEGRRPRGAFPLLRASCEVLARSLREAIVAGIRTHPFPGRGLREPRAHGVDPAVDGRHVLAIHVHPRDQRLGSPLAKPLVEPAPCATEVGIASIAQRERSAAQAVEIERR